MPSSPTGNAAGAARPDGGAHPFDAPLRGSALLLVGRFVAIAGGLVVQVLVVRHLSQTAYGDFAYALAIVNVLTVRHNVGKCSV